VLMHTTLLDSHPNLTNTADETNTLEVASLYTSYLRVISVGFLLLGTLERV